MAGTSQLSSHLLPSSKLLRVVVALTGLYSELQEYARPDAIHLKGSPVVHACLNDQGFPVCESHLLQSFHV